MVDIVRQQRQIRGEQQGCQYARQQQHRDLPHHGKVEAVFLSEPQAGFLFQQRQSLFSDTSGTDPDKDKDDNNQTVYRQRLIQRVVENGTERRINENRVAVQQPALHKEDAGERPVAL